MATSNSAKQYRFVGGPKISRTEVKSFTAEQAARQIQKDGTLPGWTVRSIIDRLQVRRSDSDPWVPVSNA